MRFSHPEYVHLLWLIPLLVVFYVVAFRRKRKEMAAFGDPQLMEKLTAHVSRRTQRWKSVAFVLGVFFLILTLLRPQFGTKLEVIRRSGLDIMVVLDTSLSMLAQDIKPSRLAHAKYEIGRLIDRLDGDRIGIVAFAGESFVQCPLTMDYGAAKMFLDALNVATIPVPGTAIGDAIRKATGAFNIKERKYKVIILLTDGEDLTQSDPVKAAREAAQEGVRIYTIGMGTRRGELIPLTDEQGVFEGYKKNRKGSIVKTKLVEEPLFQIAELTGGKYYRVRPGSMEMDKVFEDISQLEKRELESKEYTQYKERFQYPLLVAVVLLTVEILLSERRRVKEVWRGRFV